jgi:hypothetical protein
MAVLLHISKLMERREGCKRTGPADGRSDLIPALLARVLVVVFAQDDVAGEIESDEAELGTGAIVAYLDEVLMAFGASLEFDVIRGVVADVDLLAVIVVAGEALGGVRRGPDGGVVGALDDIAITAERCAVEVSDLLGRVLGTVADGLHAKLKAADGKVNVGGSGVLVFLEECGSGIWGETGALLDDGVVSLDGHAAEGSGDLYVVAAAVRLPFGFNPAPKGKRES